jgi:hypothetical protein
MLDDAVAVADKNSLVMVHGFMYHVVKVVGRIVGD